MSTQTPPSETIKIPDTLEASFDVLKDLLSAEDLDTVRGGTDEEIMYGVHHGLGQWLRNNWRLWKGDTELVKWFHGIGITHADDMSGIILTSFWRHIHDEPLNLDGQVVKYQAHWKRFGYEDGIPR